MIRHWYAHFLHVLRRFEECLRERQLAESLDPISPILQVAHATTLMDMGRYEEAIQRLEKCSSSTRSFRRLTVFLPVPTRSAGTWKRR